MFYKNLEIYSVNVKIDISYFTLNTFFANLKFNY